MCGKTARTVRREGRAQALPYPYIDPLIIISFHAPAWNAGLKALQRLYPEARVACYGSVENAAASQEPFPRWSVGTIMAVTPERGNDNGSDAGARER